MHEEEIVGRTLEDWTKVYKKSKGMESSSSASNMRRFKSVPKQRSYGFKEKDKSVVKIS